MKCGKSWNLYLFKLVLSATQEKNRTVEFIFVKKKKNITGYKMLEKSSIFFDISNIFHNDSFVSQTFTNVLNRQKGA